jgi:hypothetical protein
LVEEESTGAAHPVYVQKRPFLDLLAHGIPNIPEKIEGMAFGPDLEDGRLLLVLSSDNDFSATENSRYFAFAVDRAELPDYRPQHIASPPASRGHEKSAGHH